MAMTNSVRPVQARQVQARPVQARAVQARPAQIRPAQIRPVRVRPLQGGVGARPGAATGAQNGAQAGARPGARAGAPRVRTGLVRLQVSADDTQRRALSRRELQVLTLVADGGTRDVISEQLDISPGTVASHMTRIYRALGARNAAHAVALAYGSGVLPYQTPLLVQPHLQPQQHAPIVSRRERQVLAGLAYGLTSEQVAEYLHLSIETVKTHLRRVYRKLDVNCRANAVDRAIRGHVLAVIVYTDGTAMRPGLGRAAV